MLSKHTLIFDYKGRNQVGTNKMGYLMGYKPTPDCYKAVLIAACPGSWGGGLASGEQSERSDSLPTQTQA